MNGTRILLALALFAIASPLWAQGFELQHFRCYPVLKTEPDLKGTVELQDQFDSPTGPGERVDFFRAKRFCNPTAKYHSGLPIPFFPITDDRQHLTFYPTFPQQAPIRVAVVENQFGPQTLLLRAPVAMAVPTRKLEPILHEFPDGLDHFRCYGAWGSPISEGVFLSDQFLTGFAGHLVLNPVAFCNPARKRPIEPPGEEVPIQNRDLHLTCYSMTRVQFEGETLVTNQFDDQALSVGFPDTLCAPSRKVDWFPIGD